jgi:hypothetical protein
LIFFSFLLSSIVTSRSAASLERDAAAQAAHDALKAERDTLAASNEQLHTVLTLLPRPFLTSRATIRERDHVQTELRALEAWADKVTACSIVDVQDGGLLRRPIAVPGVSPDRLAAVEAQRNQVLHN